MSGKIGSVLNYIAALFLFAFGLIYLFKISFMSYHSEAFSLEWNDVERHTQVLILALMRAVSGGYIATSIVIIVLQRKFSSTRSSWIPTLILASGLIVGITSIYATIIVRLYSSGKPPTAMVGLGIMLLIAGFVFNRRSLKSKKKASLGTP